MAIWHSKHFKLEESEKRQVQEELSGLPLKQVSSSSGESRPPYTGGNQHSYLLRKGAAERSLSGRDLVHFPSVPHRPHSLCLTLPGPPAGCQPSINSLRFCCRKVGPFQNLKGALVLTLGTKLSEENTGDEARDFTGEGAQAKSRRGREPRRAALPHRLGFYEDGITFWVVSGKGREGKPLSRVRLFLTPWTVAHQAPPSIGFSRQEYQSGVPFPSPGDLPDPGTEPGSPALQADTLPSEPPGKSSGWS